MIRTSSAIALSLAAAIILASVTARAAREYPRETTPMERAATMIAWSVDTISAESLTALYLPIFGIERQLAHVDWAYYLDPDFKNDPRSFYPDPAKPERFASEELFIETDEAVVTQLRWPSSYRPANPDFEPLYAGYPETHDAYALYFKSKNGNKAALLVNHGWNGKKLTKEYKDRHFFEYVKNGYDVMFMQQPYHGFRAPLDSAFSGELFFSGEIARIDEAFRQTVTDSRGMVLWLRDRYEVVGAQGGSLGGITTLLLAANEPGLDFAVAWVPPSNVGVIPEDSALAGFVGMGMRKSGLTRADIEAVLYVSNPANFEPAIQKDDVLIIAGMGDNFVPPEQPAEVWAAWDRPPIQWFAGGHAVNFQEKACRARELEFIKARLP